MNIKDIAKLAGVSVSTVSKIMNNKADSISEETRQKVLDIAKKYHYSPYAGVKNLNNNKSFLIALVYAQQFVSSKLISKLESAVSRYGYHMILYNCAGDQQTDLRNLQIAQQSGVDGILYIPWDNPAESLKLLEKLTVPKVLINHPNTVTDIPVFTYDYRNAAKEALSVLANLGHDKIGLLKKPISDWKTKEISRAFEQHTFHSEIVFDKNWIGDSSVIPQMHNSGITALICEDHTQAKELYRFCHQKHIIIPKELSVVALCEDYPEHLSPALQAISLGTDELALAAAADLIEMIEGSISAHSLMSKPTPYHITGQSIAPPLHHAHHYKPILVVGSLNMDVTLQVSHMPYPGETLLIDSLISLPGGKGANQAVGAARLGAKVNMIGCIGDDYAGKILYGVLRENNVNTSGIFTNPRLETGKAYINVSQNGDSYIQVFAGANNSLGKSQIDSCLSQFQQSNYFLIQTEIPKNAVSYAIDKAAKLGMYILCKPCSIDKLWGDWIQKVNIIIPNESEALLLSGKQTTEEQADYFLEQGAEHVIITLAEKGCYYKSGAKEQYYPAFDFKSVDTTGASDAFISAFAVYLSEGNHIENCIRFALCAAGLSITREGVQPALPDRLTMDLYLQQYPYHL